jgi:heme A synthase
MYALALLVIALSGYVSFAKKREGADPARSVGEAMLLAVLFVAFLGGATYWLSGASAIEVADWTLSIIGLAFVTALVGVFSAGLKPRRDPLPFW